MYWIYILECNDDFFYVGQTKRLYTRIREHFNDKGGANTYNFIPQKVVAIYKVNIIKKFLDYHIYVNDIINNSNDTTYIYSKLHDFNDSDNDKYDYLCPCGYNCFDKISLCAENNIVECLMIHRKNEWKNFRGGKYVRFDINYKYPKNNYIGDLPLCKCKLPCDIKKNDIKNILYFRCAKKNMFDNFRNEFDCWDPSCNFYMEYTKDKEIKIFKDKLTIERNNLFKNAKWLRNVKACEDNKPNICMCGCDKLKNKITYLSIKKNLCYNCFYTKYNELSNIYDSVFALDD